ncbi:MAG: MazG-like family protein [Kyrpidia sp.]|nr:MazG-like family protein [Kyrpidia sp.]
MPTFRRDMDIGRQVKLVEWLKLELLDQVSSLFRAFHTGAEGLIADSLSGLLISVYILARRVGLSPGEIDRRAVEKLEKTRQIGHEAETWFGDLGVVENHLRGR